MVACLLVHPIEHKTQPNKISQTKQTDDGRYVTFVPETNISISTRMYGCDISQLDETVV